MRNQDPYEHLRLMYKYAKTLNSLIEDGELTRESLGRSQLIQAGTVKFLELIGEEAWQLTKADVDLGPDIPLLQIANMRHRMVHAYEGVNWSVVEEAAFEDVPQLIVSIQEICASRSIHLDPRD